MYGTGSVYKVFSMNTGGLCSTNIRKSIEEEAGLCSILLWLVRCSSGMSCIEIWDEGGSCERELKVHNYWSRCVQIAFCLGLVLFVNWCEISSPRSWVLTPNIEQMWYKVKRLTRSLKVRWTGWSGVASFLISRNNVAMYESSCSRIL